MIWKYKIYKTIFVSISILVIGYSFFNNRRKDLFSEILKATNSEIVEFGIRASFRTNIKEEIILRRLLKEFSFEDLNTLKDIMEDKHYNKNFGNNFANGHIQIEKENNENVIIIDVKSSKYDINHLKNKISTVADNKAVRVKYWPYIKARTSNENMEYLNEQIIQILKNRDIKDIDSIKIENGYSTVAYTRLYDAIENGGRLMDFNYAVTSYSSGNYIILASPLITFNY
jgi:aldehyde:ferredoxin oxidoreductase